MKIVICASIDFTPMIKEVMDKLVELGHKVTIPHTSEAILRGELTLEEFKAEKERLGDGGFRENVERKIKNDVIREYYKLIGESDAILVLNPEKKHIPDYIGGNTFLEMGFAHVLRKKIFLWGGVPDMHYSDEIATMRPTLINGDLSQIK